jgi:HSP20 family protein
MSYISRYEPATLLNEVNRIIEQAFRPMGEADTSKIETSQWIPAVDIKEDKQQFIILADLPGVEKENINISMENNVLTIKGTRATETKEEKPNYFRIERTRGNFYRRFTLPDTADGSKIEAKLQKGVLEVCIPKKEAAQPRLINIQSED